MIGQTRVLRWSARVIVSLFLAAMVTIYHGFASRGVALADTPPLLPSVLTESISGTLKSRNSVVPNQAILIRTFPGFVHVQTVVSDAQGRFEVDNLPKGEYSAFVLLTDLSLPIPLYTDITVAGVRTTVPFFSAPSTAPIVLQNSLLTSRIAQLGSTNRVPSSPQTRSVLFATDRAPLAPPNIGFADAPADCDGVQTGTVPDPLACLSYGRVAPVTKQVTIFPPPAALPGGAVGPADAALIDALKDAFLAQPAPAPGAAPNLREVVIFLHGCCSSFAMGVDDGLIVANGVTPPHALTSLPVIVYSFPAMQNLTAPKFNINYLSDETETVWSSQHLAGLIHSLLTDGNVDRIDLIAHSLGNRVLFPALQLLALEHPEDRHPKIGNVLFVAPDIDLATFQEAAATIGSVAEHATVYRSDNDMVILTAQRLHEHPRLGYLDYPSSPDIRPVTAIDASTFICYDPKNPDYVSGHFYWKASEIAFADVAAALAGKGPADSPRSAHLTKVGNDQWRFDVPKQGEPDVPDGSCIHAKTHL